MYILVHIIMYSTTSISGWLGTGNILIFPHSLVVISSKKACFTDYFSLLTRIVYEYSLLHNSLSSKEIIMYNSGKFQESNFIFFRLRMNLSCNDTNTSKVLHFWVEICIKPQILRLFCVYRMISQTFRPPIPHFPIYRG